MIAVTIFVLLPIIPIWSPRGNNAGAKARIQKVLANAGVASRRGVEEMVQQGRIAVNGKITTGLPILINPEKDTIEIDGEPLRIKPRQTGPRLYLLMNKPKGVYSTN